jgi:adenylyltransferase/sulfurtransferase
MTGALADKRVLLVGAGGLGSPVGALLARAGVGYLELLDDDQVELTNLHRQTLYAPDDVGQSKAQRAALRLAREAERAGHVHTRVAAREQRLLPDTALELARGFDLVVEGSDNYPTKFLTADCCHLLGIPSVQAACVRWVGWVLGHVPEGRDRAPSACLRCAFEDIPEGPDRGCSQAGVVGPLVGVIGALQAAVALRLLLGDHRAAGVLHHYRALDGVLRKRRLARRAGCALCDGRITRLDRASYSPLPRELRGMNL